jgi:hypothetical protein
VVKAALFLTAEADSARALLAAWQMRHPEAQWTVFVRDDLRTPLASALAGCELRRDKAIGSRMAMLRALRRERFDLLVVAWQGGDRSEPLKLAAWCSGARRVIAVDERQREIEVRWSWPWAAMHHCSRRLVSMPPGAWLRPMCAVYRATLGGLLGTIWLAIAWVGARSQKSCKAGGPKLP